MGRYLLAHDLGTSGNKAVLYSVEGKLIGSRTYSYETYYTNNNWVEQNAEDWWEAVCATSKSLLEGIDSAEVAAVSFSGQMMGCVCVGHDGNALRNSLIWADMRATEEEALIRSRMGEEEFYHITGHRISPSYGGQKFMWVKKHEPDVYENTYKMLNAKDYMILKLTDEFVTEYTDASSTCLLNLKSLTWSDRLLEVMEIDREKLPRLLKSTDIAGYVTEKAAALTGLLAGTPVVCGGGDGVCAAVGTGCTKEGVAHSCMGTSSWISITSKEPIYDEQMRTFTWAHMVPGYVLPTGTMQSGGGSFAWFTDRLCQYEKTCAKEQGISQYDILDEEISRSKPGSNGLLFLPYLVGERSPRWNPNAKGGFIGLKMEHEKKDLIRSVQEGVAMNMEIILDTFRKHEQEINEIVVIGGGAKSRMWREILASVYGCRILKPNVVEEATSMGAAITAGVGVGIFPDFDVLDRFLTIDEVQEPVEEDHKVYEKLKLLFNEAYECLMPLYDKLSEYR